MNVEKVLSSLKRTTTTTPQVAESAFSVRVAVLPIMAPIITPLRQCIQTALVQA